MLKAQKAIRNDRRPEVLRSDENEITQPIRVVCSSEPHPGQPRDPRERWFTQLEESLARTPDWTEIGGTPAA